MKNKSLLLLSCSALLLFFSCKGKQEQTYDPNALPVFEFDSEDSLAIKSLAEQYISFFKSGDLDAAASMLYIVRHDSVIPLPADQAEQYKYAMNTIPVFDCSLRETVLYSDRDNEVRIALQISENGNMETGEGCINFFLNPIEKDGRWFLTLRDEYAEGVGLYH